MSKNRYSTYIRTDKRQKATPVTVPFTKGQLKFAMVLREDGTLSEYDAARLIESWNSCGSSYGYALGAEVVDKVKDLGLISARGKEIVFTVNALTDIAKIMSSGILKQVADLDKSIASGEIDDELLEKAKKLAGASKAFLREFNKEE